MIGYWLIVKIYVNKRGYSVISYANFNCASRRFLWVLELHATFTSEKVRINAVAHFIAALSLLKSVGEGQAKGDSLSMEGYPPVMFAQSELG
jgi:hypothetical protein